MPDIQVREISLDEKQRDQRHQSLSKMTFNWEAIPTVGFIGFILSVALFVVSMRYHEPTVDFFIFVSATGSVIGAALGYYNERRRKALMPAAEKRWHTEYIALCGKIEKFSERLEAYREIAKTFDRFEEIDHTLVGKYLSEREALANRMKVFLRAMAIKRFDEAVANDADGSFRDTRDVTEHLFAHHVRVSPEQDEIRELTTAESPNEAQFRELEALYADDDSPVSNAQPARRSS